MEDLLRSQIQDSCRLALPNGLKELMSDISREVLRAQPKNLLQFITDYLSTLLITRENLFIAAQICNTVCDCDCRPELEDELRRAGMDEAIVNDIIVIIQKHIEKGDVKEGNIMMKLINKTSIEESDLPAVLQAVKNAFLRHQRNHAQFYESSPSSEDNEVERAVKHTMALYRKGRPTVEVYNAMAKKIQAAYRAFRIRQESGKEKIQKTNKLSTLISSSDSLLYEDYAQAVKSTEISEKSKVTFGTIDRSTSDKSLDIYESQDGSVSLGKLSSSSLGSYIRLPKYGPHLNHNFDNLEETPEKERSNYDYTQENIVDEQTKKQHENTRKNTLFESHEELSDDYYSVEEVGSYVYDSAEPEIDLSIDVNEIDLIENSFDMHLEPTVGTEMEFKPEDNIDEASYLTEDNIDEASYLTEDNIEVHSVPGFDNMDENIDEASNFTDNFLMEITPIAPKLNNIDKYIQKTSTTAEETKYGLQNIAEEDHSVPNSDEIDGNKEEIGIKDDIINKKVDENIEQTGDKIEENDLTKVDVQNKHEPQKIDENIETDVIEENIVIDDEDAMEDIPEDINGSY